MPEEKNSHRFLLETCSQQLHREEAMRRRRELLEKESTKPPVMHFGSTFTPHRNTATTAPTNSCNKITTNDDNKKGKSVSPVPRPVTTTSGYRTVRSSRSAPPSAAASTARSRPQSRESSRRLPLPPGGKMPTRKMSLPRAKSYHVSPVTSRVPSPAARIQAVAPFDTERSHKRPLSRSISRTNPRLKQRRFSLSQTSHSLLTENKVPFMSSLSPTRNASPFRQTTSRTPTPPPVSRPLQRHDGNNADIPITILVPPLRAEEESKSLLPVDSFALLNTAERKMREVKMESEEREEELMSFRISEFRMPRTPQRRSGVATHSLPQVSTSAGKDVQEPRSTEKEGNYSACVNVTVAPHSVGEETTRLHSLETESVCISTNLDDNTMLTHDIGKLSDYDDDHDECVNGEVDKSIQAVAESCGDQTISPPVLTLMSTDMIVTSKQEETAVSAFSSHAYECSSTTTESSDEEIEAFGGRQLMFEDEEETKEKEVRVSIHKLVACECVQPIPVNNNVESGTASQNFFECLSGPSTPLVQLPEAYRQLEATRREMATNSTYQRESPAVTKVAAVRRPEGRLGESRRGSLLLVAGDLPAVYTPAIQEPHTPPPAPEVQVSHLPLSRTPPPKCQNSFTLCDASPIPRPVTLRSQVPSISRQEHTDVFLSLSPREGRSTPYPHASLSNVLNDMNEEIVDDKEHPIRDVVDAGTPNTTTRSHSHSACGRKSVVEQLMECCPSDVRKEAEELIAADIIAVNSTPLRTMGSGQLSDVLTASSSISQRVATRPRKYYYDYSYWERHLHDSTTKGLQKTQRRVNKKAKKASSHAMKPNTERENVNRRTKVCHKTEEEAPAKGTNTIAVATAVPGTRNSAPRVSALTSASSSHASTRKRSTSSRISLWNSISRRNRDRIILQRRRLSRRQTK